jgi:hypothetical protein
MDRSASIAGRRGAMTILPMKLRKKMEARRRIGPIRERKVGSGSFAPVAGLFKFNSSHRFWERSFTKWQVKRQTAFG